MKTIKGILFAIILFPAFGLVSCTSGAARVEEQNYSLVDIRRAIISVVGQPRSISDDERLILTQYFGPKSDKKFDSTKSKVRKYGRISIIGDRRPYDVSADVFVEEKQEGHYEETGTDDNTAHAMVRAIKKRLHQSPEDRNVIDDFRAF